MLATCIYCSCSLETRIAVKLKISQLSLTSVCSKILGHIIYSSIMFHLNRKNILSDVQYGFRENLFLGHSLLQLMTLYKD